MKRFYILPLLCFLFLVGCNNDGDDIEVATSLKLDSTTTIEMSKYASSTEIWFETNSDWTASIVSTDGGFDIEPKSGQYGNNNKVTLIAEENTMFDIRTATVTIEANGVRQSVKIEQAQGTEIATLSDTEIFFDAVGGEATLDLETNIAYEVVVGDEEATWLTIPSTKAYGIDAITLSAEPNTEGTIRSALVYINALLDNSTRDSIYVYQKGDNILELSETSLEVGSSGGKTYFSFVTEEDAEYGVNIQAIDSDWIRGEIGEYTDTEKMAEFTVSSNTTGLSRRATVSVWRSVQVPVEGTYDSITDTYQTVAQITSQDVIIIQDANLLLTSDKSIQSDAGEYVAASGYGGLISFPVSANIEYIVTVPSAAADWISLYSGVDEVDGEVQLVLEENETGATRQATIMVEALDYDDLYFEVVIKQSAEFMLEAIGDVTSFVCPSQETTTVEISVRYYPDMSPDTPKISDGGWITMTESGVECENEFEYKYTFVVDPFVSTGDYSRSSTIYFTRYGEADTLAYTINQNYILENNYGSLSSLLTDTYGDDYISTIDVLKVNGTVNNADLNTLAGMQILNNLDLSEATIVGNIRIDSDGNSVVGNATPYRWLRGNSVLETLILPKNLNIIGESSFEDCTGLKTSFELPSTLTVIGATAFKGCINYNGSFAFPDPLLSIGEEAFANCTSLVGDLYFYNNLVTIAPRAFYGCTALNGSLKLSRALEVIEESVFEGCSSLGGGLFLPISVVEVKKNAFKNCSSMSGELTLSSALTTIGESAFEGCASLSGTLAMPSYLETVSKAAFKGCSSFTAVTLSSKLAKIENEVFAYCTSIAAPLSIPTDITEIGNFAFYRCTGMKGTVILHSRLASVGDYAFYGCTGLTGTLSIKMSLTDIGKYAFAYCTSMSGALDILTSANADDDKITELKAGTFMNSALTGSFTVPNSVVTIGENAISGTKQAGSLSFPESLKNIGTQESIVATAIEFKWTESVPSDITNILKVLDDRYLLETTMDPFTITIPYGSTAIYETLLAKYRFEEKSQYE